VIAPQARLCHWWPLRGGTQWTCVYCYAILPLSFISYGYSSWLIAIFAGICTRINCWLSRCQKVS
jgi:hypothetical protein